MKLSPEKKALTTLEHIHISTFFTGTAPSVSSEQTAKTTAEDLLDEMFDLWETNHEPAQGRIDSPAWITASHNPEGTPAVSLLPRTVPTASESQVISQDVPDDSEYSDEVLNSQGNS